MNKIKTPLNNIIKIMDIVIKKIEAGSVVEEDNAPLISDLLQKGFKLEDIDTAMLMVNMMTSQVSPIVDAGQRDVFEDGRPSGIRHLHFTESLRLSSAAQRLVLKLVEDGVITQLHFEKALEYIWRNDLRHVTSSRLELILMLNRPASEEQPDLGGGMPVSVEFH